VRILHTSDWHLGRTFHGESLIDEQRQAVDRVVQLATEHQVDLVVVAGDLYDRAIPPTEAVQLFDDALVMLRGTGAQVVAIAGNHDSATRVAHGDRLLRAAGVTVRGSVAALTDPLVVAATDGGPPVAVYPLPFLEPSVAGPVLESLPGGARVPDPESDGRRRLSHHDVTVQAMDVVRAHARSLGQVRTVVVAHTFVIGGSPSESERDISIGNIDLVELSAFHGLDYVALGHLHGAQEFDGGRVAYSGTPLPYSFSEEHHTKSVRIVDLAPDGSVSTTKVPLDVGLPLCTIKGEFQDLLDSPAFAQAEQARVRIRLTDRQLPMQAMGRLQQRFPHAVVLQHLPDGVEDPTMTDFGERRQADPVDLARRFWADMVESDPTEAEDAVLVAAIAAANKEQDA
jgi:exonuclease SbcD